MRFKEVVARLTGLSSPVFGVSWNPPEADVTVARRVVANLEDRRVLYNPASMEIPDHCVHSVMDIRRHLTHELQALDGEGDLSASLRAMRAACRKFLDTVGADDRTVRFGHHDGHWASWVFNGALGELRGVFGVHVAKLAAANGLDVEDGLAAILPAPSEADGKDEEVSQRGSILASFSLPDRETFEIEPYRHDDGIWRVKVGHHGDPVTLMSLGHATRLADAVRSHDPELAQQIGECIEAARELSGG